MRRDLAGRSRARLLDCRRDAAQRLATARQLTTSDAIVLTLKPGPVAMRAASIPPAAVGEASLITRVSR